MLYAIWFIFESSFWIFAVVLPLIFLIFAAFGVPTYGAPVVGIFITLLGLYTLRAIRRRRARLVLTYLEQAIRLNLPLSPMLHAAAQSEPEPTKSRLVDLRAALDQGAPIAESLEVAVPELSLRNLGLIRSAERSGQLAKTLGRLAHTPRRNLSFDPTEPTFLLAYPIAMLLALAGIVGLICVYVLPKYIQIFRDFKVSMPPSTRFFLAAWDEFQIPLAVVAFIGLLIFFGYAARERFYPGAVRRRWAGGWFTGYRDLADITRVIGDALEGGMTLNAALDDAATLSIGSSLRQRLVHWSELAGGGLSPAESARAAGMPNLLSGLMATTPDATNHGEAFIFLSRYYSTRFSRVRILLRGAALPAIVFCFGFCVMMVAVGLFEPIVRLIDVTMPYPFAL